jgi:hypothetical protein
MRTRAHCSCGWQRELSEFYAGKRIRCPDCMALVEVPGDSVPGPYQSRLPERAPAFARYTAPTRRPFQGSSLLILMLGLVLAINLWRLQRPDPWVEGIQDVQQIERPEPEAPEAAQPARPTPPPAREYTPPTGNEDEF